MSLQSSTGDSRTLDRIRTTAADVFSQSRDRAAQVGSGLRQAAETSKTRSAAGAQAALAQARKRPVSTGLLLLGVVAGGALLANPAARRLALANAPRIWRMVRARTDRFRHDVA